VDKDAIAGLKKYAKKLKQNNQEKKYLK